LNNNNKWYIIISTVGNERGYFMWTSVYMTQNIETARDMRNKMEKCSIIVMLHPIIVEDRAGEEYYELLVPKAELSEALDIIIAE